MNPALATLAEALASPAPWFVPQAALAPWFAPYAALARQVLARAAHQPVAEALNAALASTPIALAAGPLRFVSQSALPAGEPYEAFIARTAQVPTRCNPHDFFNGLVWLTFPQLKRRLNELQAEAIARDGVRPTRGAVRDALTLFDENAAWLQADEAVIDALRRRDWHTAFVTQRGLWAQARVVCFGHALLEKLLAPRKPITAHVWAVPHGVPAAEWLAGCITPELLASKPHLPLPVLGVPGWWPDNEAPGFYADAAVFRPPRPGHQPLKIDTPPSTSNAVPVTNDEASDAR